LTTESSVSAYLARDSVNDMVRICDLSRVNTAPRQPRCGTLSGYLPCLSPAPPPEGLTMDSDHSIAVRNTYRYLRLAMIAVVLMLFLAVGIERLSSTGWQTSISAYYFTAVHAVFIAALCTIGACLIVYQGNTDTEEVVLNFSGFLAFVVAFVPTQREPLYGPGLPATYEVGMGIRNNVLALIITGVVVEIARIIINRNVDRRPLSPWAKRATLIGWAVIGVGILGYAAFPANFEAKGHTVAAVTMFVGIIAVIVLNALSAQSAQTGPSYVGSYKVIAGLMALLVLAIVLIRLTLPEFAHIVIWIEGVLILAFAAFWLVQTKELWDVVDRRDLAPNTTDPTGR
jgi:hypothetical protein